MKWGKSQKSIKWKVLLEWNSEFNYLFVAFLNDLFLAIPEDGSAYNQSTRQAYTKCFVGGFLVVCCPLASLSSGYKEGFKRTGPLRLQMKLLYNTGGSSNCEDCAGNPKSTNSYLVCAKSK